MGGLLPLKLQVLNMGEQKKERGWKGSIADDTISSKNKITHRSHNKITYRSHNKITYGSP
jgi:hypothetical protein